MAHLMIYMSFNNSTGPDPNAFETDHVVTTDIIAGLDGIGSAPFPMLKSYPATLDPLSFGTQTQTSCPRSSSLSSLPRSPP